MSERKTKVILIDDEYMHHIIVEAVLGSNDQVSFIGALLYDDGKEAIDGLVEGDTVILLVDENLPDDKKSTPLVKQARKMSNEGLIRLLVLSTSADPEELNRADLVDIPLQTGQLLLVAAAILGFITGDLQNAKQRFDEAVKEDEEKNKKNTAKYGKF